MKECTTQSHPFINQNNKCKFELIHLEFDMFVNIAVGLFIVGLAAVMLYERTSPKSNSTEDTKLEKTRDK
jgi:hypothetical protein